jgi:hypothetical protein
VLIILGIANKDVYSGSWEWNVGNSSFRRVTRLFGLSGFTKYSRGGWTLDISEGCDTRLVDAAIRAALSPNALYLPEGSNQS